MCFRLNSFLFNRLAKEGQFLFSTAPPDHQAGGQRTDRLAIMLPNHVQHSALSQRCTADGASREVSVSLYNSGLDSCCGPTRVFTYNLQLSRCVLHMHVQLLIGIAEDIVRQPSVW